MPGREIVGDVKETPLPEEKTELPAIVIKQGVDNDNRVAKYAYERGVAEAGQTVAILMQGWFFPFRLERNAALSFDYIAKDDELKEKRRGFHAFSIIKK